MNWILTNARGWRGLSWTFLEGVRENCRGRGHLNCSSTDKEELTVRKAGRSLTEATACAKAQGHQGNLALVSQP